MVKYETHPDSFLFVEQGSDPQPGCAGRGHAAVPPVSPLLAQQAARGEVRSESDGLHLVCQVVVYVGVPYLQKGIVSNLHKFIFSREYWAAPWRPGPCSPAWPCWPGCSRRGPPPRAAGPGVLRQHWRPRTQSSGGC